MKEHGGEKIIKKYGCVRRALQSIYPHHKWLPWKFTERVPSGYWDDPQSQRSYIEWLGEELKVRRMEDWYSVTMKDAMKNGGATLVMTKYNGSPFEMISSILSEHKWEMQKLKGYWNDVENHRSFVKNRLTKELKIEKMSEWYNVKLKEIVEKGGGSLMERYNNSPSKMITTVMSEHNWNMKEFKNRKVWNDIENQKEHLARLAKELKIKRMEEWYEVGAAQIREKGGDVLLWKYEHSPSKMITSILSEHKWDHKRFRQRRGK